MSEPPKSSVDPSKIKGPYPLLALLLLIVEGLLGYWFFRAEGSIERSVAGVLMTAIFLAVVWAVIRIVERPRVRVRGLDTSISLVEKEATRAEIDSPAPEVMAGPDGSYLINRPPADWTVDESSISEWIERNLGISERAANQVPIGGPKEKIEVTAFRSPRLISAMPQPGITKIDGRQFPTALEVTMQTMLTIAPINRAQPPFYIERPLSHNFLKEITVIASAGPVTLRGLTSGTLPGSGRKFQKAEFSQRLENAIIDGKEGQSADANITVIGIEGDLCDYILMMHYPSRLANRPDVEADQAALLSLVSSFRPLKLVNPDQKREELRQQADSDLKKLLEEHGAQLLSTELRVALLRVKQLNLHDPKARLRAIELLKPFEAFANQLNVEDEMLNSFFASLHQAEAADATDFITNVQELINVASGQQPTQLENPVPENVVPGPDKASVG